MTRAGFDGDTLEVALGVGFAESGGFVDGQPVAYLDAVGDYWQVIPGLVIGDTHPTIASCARVFRAPWEDVAAFNNITNPNLVHPGDVIYNPTFKQRYDRLNDGIRGMYPTWADGAWQIPDGDPVWGPSVGWFQIRTLHDPPAYGPFVKDWDNNPIPVRDLDFLAGNHEAVKSAGDAQAAAALVVSNRGEDWTPWTAYRSGAWENLGNRGFTDYQLITGHPRAGRWNLAALAPGEQTP